MEKYKHLPAIDLIFGSLFVVANRLDTLLDRALRPYGITSKQWLLSIVVKNSFEEPPTMKETAKEMGCSHQNVKQMALKLKEKGVLEMEKDEKDHRVTRMSLTQKRDDLWKEIMPKGYEFKNKIFNGIAPEEMEIMRSALLKILDNIEQMDEKNLKRGRL